MNKRRFQLTPECENEIHALSLFSDAEAEAWRGGRFSGQRSTFAKNLSVFLILSLELLKSLKTRHPADG